MHDLMIEGTLPAAGSLEVRSPFDGKVLDTVATAGPEHVDAALGSAYALFRKRESWLSVPQRIEILQRTAELMNQEAGELAMLAASEGAGPVLR